MWKSKLLDVHCIWLSKILDGKAFGCTPTNSTKSVQLSLVFVGSLTVLVSWGLSFRNLEISVKIKFTIRLNKT